MLRVSAKGAAVYEARDSILMRLAVRFNLTPEYETAPAALTGGTHGGYRNGPIPNYVYRWTERVVETTVKSYLPAFQHSFHYTYGFRIPTQRLAMSPSFPKRFIAKCAEFLVPLLELVLRKQGNEFGFLVTKRDSLQPWMMEADGELKPDLEYLRNEYRVDKYQK